MTRYYVKALENAMSKKKKMASVNEMIFTKAEEEGLKKAYEIVKRQAKSY